MHIIIEILVFLIVIVVLILVHELGHFIVAKLSGMRVDEFGIGYPPRALTIAKIGETEYTLNWLPFGGFVRIYGEDGIAQNSDETVATEVSEDGEFVPLAESQISPGTGSAVASHRAFGAKARILQALTLVAGIAMNIILAYVLLTVTLILGTQQALTPSEIAHTPNAEIVLASVDTGSPADLAGFKAGDIVKSATTTTSSQAVNYNGNNPEGLATLISMDTAATPMQFLVNRNGKEMQIIATPKKQVISGQPDHVALGVSLAAIGTIKTPLIQAPVQGLTYTWNVIVETAQGLWNLLKGIFTFSADLSQVSGPVGIAGIVGQSVSQGLSAVLSLAALISINLALVNLIPIPALDGGRLLFVIIEAITRKPINPKVSNMVNSIGFGLLILLMVVITGHDIWNLIK
jgi:regulator of sigma E protease